MNTGAGEGGISAYGDNWMSGVAASSIAGAGSSESKLSKGADKSHDLHGKDGELDGKDCDGEPVEQFSLDTL
ncbi:hypothetical protein SADUNF_Sadunf12G0064400 [Salix dunnii]|uniref:Uncharacterized protein n=1 Tax=Salix dunnii TaxID=1413687 RepID=A0A835MN24_9ROSI|nr:hypothetical protein SADUNF_Sadunf12G0064400 [Salix dunnii]